MEVGMVASTSQIWLLGWIKNAAEDNQKQDKITFGVNKEKERKHEYGERKKRRKKSEIEKLAFGVVSSKLPLIIACPKDRFDVSRGKFVEIQRPQIEKKKNRVGSRHRHSAAWLT